MVSKLVSLLSLLLALLLSGIATTAAASVPEQSI